MFTCIPDQETSHTHSQYSPQQIFHPCLHLISLTCFALGLLWNSLDELQWSIQRRETDILTFRWSRHSMITAFLNWANLWSGWLGAPPCSTSMFVLDTHLFSSDYSNQQPPLSVYGGLLDRNFLSSNPTWGRSGGWKWVWHRYPACCRRFWPYCGYERVQYFLGYVPVSPLIFFFFRFFPRHFWTLLTSSIAKVWKCDWFPDFSLKKFE
jgi:hypothetical protein